MSEMFRKFLSWTFCSSRQREAHVNYYNGLRQHAVNAAAEHYGAGTGTAAYYGVPGRQTLYFLTVQL